jgi:hypothetical protein
MSSNRNRIAVLAAALTFVLTFALAPRPAAAVTLRDIIKGPYGSTYTFVWDGFQGRLTFYSSDALTLTVGTTTYYGRFVYGANAQDVIDGYQGPGYRVNTANAHRVVVWIDFNNTPNNRADDQRFDGYWFTQTNNGMAGVTWWSNIPFGYYMTFLGNVVTL